MDHALTTRFGRVTHNDFLWHSGTRVEAMMKLLNGEQIGYDHLI